MDSHILEFYKECSADSQKGNFRKVIALHDAKELSFESLLQKGVQINKGWFELSKLSIEDRIGFTKEFWVSTLPYHPNVAKFIDEFFDSLDDIGVFITQKHYEDEYSIQMVYSLKDNNGFYRGFEPVLDDEITDFEKAFPEFIFPADYLGFLRIHNGFRKATDKTGIFKAKHMSESYDKFQEMIEKSGGVVTTERGLDVNPRSLIPFYESFGMPFFQCFWADWYPQNVTGMGNVYFSTKSKQVSAPLNYEHSSSLNMAYTTFLDWLMFYLERVE